ncbi:uncharacterized protein LOC143598421 [Bidens hawaiensis]|uniref:uncharacterized protein LOC143598421 n=1 Tax=Bidens hawaiensis TaxID=980011 RepID=UPI00404A3D3F
MDKVLQRFQDLKIQLEEIKSATNNFDHKNNIGVGGFGKVYKGELSHSEGRSMVAIKRLDRRHGQGEAEFLKEITMLSRYKHENLISLLGFCYEGDEAILVYEFASRGDLGEHLGSPDLTWSKRIRICLDAAKGLSHLHDPRGTHQRLIHCDVKSGNILLDDQWNAKVADFGFSIMGPANELQSTVINLAAGTCGYCDPQYAMTNTLTKESDVYSFGVVLVEVLCGALCYSYNNGSVEYNLVPAWTKSYEEKKLNDIIFKRPTTQPLYQSSLETFSAIAYRCLRESREDRPNMSEVVTELETALEIQELKSSRYDDILKSAEPPLNYGSEDELMMLLSKGVLLNDGKTYFSLNKLGEHREMISIAECLGSEFENGHTEYNSRFPVGTYHSENGIFKTRVKPQFLSPGITYTVNLVFKFRYKEKARRCEDIYLKYKLQGEIETLVSEHAYKREDGWWMAKLHQFTCDQKIVDLQILFDGFQDITTIDVEGIEFRPLERWFSLNKNGEHCEMISIAECLTSEFKFWGKDNARFSKDTNLLSYGIFKTHVKTQFLSPGITYTVNLVYKFKHKNMVRRCEQISLKYKLQGEVETLVSYLAYERGDGCFTAELYQLTCDHEVVNLQILFEGFARQYGTIEAEGIEFLPLEKVRLHH